MALHRWAGSKRRIVSQALAKLPPRKWKRVIVPFYGGGADAHECVRRDLADEYHFSDVCRPLIDAHLGVAHYPEAVLGHLLQFSKLSEEDQEIQYYQLRKTFSQEEQEHFPVWRAFRFLVMVGCGFNGVWRVNQRGLPNVPFGKTLSVSEWDIREVSQILACPNVVLRSCDFGDAISYAGKGDLVLCDPPYLGMFTYGQVFRLREHLRLVCALRAAAGKGAGCFVFGSAGRGTEAIYQPAETWILRSRHLVSCRGEDRKTTGELLMRVA